MALAPAAPVHTLQWQPFWSADHAGIHVMRIPQHGANAMHDHLFREIVYVETGTAEHLTAAGPPPQRLRPGDLIVLRPLIRHAYLRPHNFGIINCLFDQPMMRRLTPLLEGVEGAFELYRRPSRRARDEAPVVLHVRPAQRPALRERLLRILAEQTSQASGWQAAATAALLDILVTAARLSRQRYPEPRVPLGRRIEQAVLDTVAHLEACYTQPVRLGELARRVGVSPAHLSRSFTRRMGVGLVAFVNQLRCEEACRLLRCTDESVSRIATSVGYNELAYFSRRFRQFTGQSPRQYARSAAQHPPGAAG